MPRYFICLFALGILLTPASLWAEPYAAQLSKHFSRHQLYPVSAELYGIEGSAIVRVMIYKDGTLLYYHYLKPPEHPTLDDAIHTMMQQADPVLPIPSPLLEDGVKTASYVFPIVFSIGHKPEMLAEVDQAFHAITDQLLKQNPHLIHD